MRHTFRQASSVLDATSIGVHVAAMARRRRKKRRERAIESAAEPRRDPREPRASVSGPLAHAEADRAIAAMQASAAGFAKAHASAERAIGGLEVEMDRRVEAAEATVRTNAQRFSMMLDSAIEATEAEMPSRSLGIGLRFRSWRQRRKVRKFVRALGRSNLPLADQGSSALLALTTERIARLSSTPRTREDVAVLMELVEAIAARYQASIAELRLDHERAESQIEMWRRGAAIARKAADAVLVARTVAQVRVWERLARSSAQAVEIATTGERRIQDALEQVRALLERSKRDVSRASRRANTRPKARSSGPPQ